MQRWNITDDNGYSMTFEMNPKEGGSFDLSKNLTTYRTMTGRSRVMVGQRKIPTAEFSGMIRTESQLKAMQDWFADMRQLKLTDDLGRVKWVFLKEFTATPAPKRHALWRHTYKAKFVEINITS